MAADRWVIVGLGNPGPEYSHNRHNVGYWCINRLARLHGIQVKARNLAAFGEGKILGTPALLIKPRTYMNASGQAVSAALRNTKVPPDNLLVVYDDLDLPAGRLRLKPKGGHGGHNGLRSIAGSIGSTDFPRLRIGIGRPEIDGEPTWDPKIVSPWVLGDPTPEQALVLQDAVSRAAECVQTLITDGVEAAMRQFNSS
jgi:PTH1 family peptidyl-tRNA hydrolase